MFYNQVGSTKVESGDSGLREFFNHVYQNVALGLLLCGATAFVTSTSPAIMNAIFRSPLALVVMFAPLGIVLFLNFRLRNMSVETAQMWYWICTACVGLSLSSIFLAFTGASIFSAFFMAGTIFLTASIYGRVTDADLSKIRSVCMIALIGIVVSGLVNIFIQSSAFEMLLSALSILVFTGLIAFENQMLKNLYYQRLAGDTLQKIAILASLSLFMSFINLFLSILRLMGRKE